MDIAKGRAEKLQEIIINGIIDCRHKKFLPEDWIRDIFGDALDDPSIKAILEEKEHEKL